VNGKIAAREDEESLLLKVFQSVLERYPEVEVLACDIESVLLEKDNGPWTMAEVMPLVPLPVRMPPSVVEAVPPYETPMVLPCQIPEVMVPRLLAVPVKYAFPETFNAKEEEGLVVPIPTFPALVTTKSVAVEEPMAKAGPEIPFGLRESSAHGVVVPMPRLPEEFQTLEPGKKVFPTNVEEANDSSPWVKPTVVEVATP